MAHLLGAEALHLEYPTRVVFDAITLGVNAGDRIGIVGRNGEGKSSLLAMLARRREPDDGRVTWRGGLRLGTLTQRDELQDHHSVAEAIVGDRAEHEWAGDPRIRDVIDGLVADVPWQGKIGELSGGQRRRVALAALLVGQWDVLALDEPTNHLDLDGVAWLAGHLRQRWAATEGALLVITHDRWFLDEVCTTTWEVHDRTVAAYEGGYAAYVLQRVERERQSAAAEAKRRNLMRKELAWLRRGAPARTAKSKFRVAAANALIADVPPPRDRVELNRLATARLGKEVVDLVDVGVTYDGREILRDVTWRIAPGERTGILGANGAGKSTLLGLIAGTVTPTAGRIKRGTTVQLGILDQEFAELADIAEDRVSQVLGRYRSGVTVDGDELTPAQLLERLGFSRAHLSARVADLSGGQRRRLQLLLVLLREPNVLILDEPSNDVDTEMLAAMEDLLDSWPGTLIVVSHDRYLLERVTDQQYAILGGRLRHVPGGVEQYLQLQAAAAADPKPSKSPQPGEARGASGAEQHAARKEIAAIERRLTRISAEHQRVQEEIAAHDHSDFTGLQRLTEELGTLDQQTATLEERWLELSDLLEESGRD